MTIAEQHLTAMQNIADNNAKFIKLAFLAAVIELRNNLIDEEALAIALDFGSMDDIMRATHVDDLENLLSGIGMDKESLIFSDEVREVFNAGAVASFFRLPLSTQKVWNYDPISTNTIAFLQQDAAQLAREIVSATKVGLQAIVSRVTAETVVTSVRIKEIKQLIGLTQDQATAVLNFRRQLETRQMLGFTNPSDRRISNLDQTLIRQHMQNGTLSTDQIDGMVERYYESLLTKRATDIANTESMNAVNNGQQKLWEQGLDEGVFSDDNIRKFWITAGDEKVRALHRVIPGMNSGGVKIRSEFITPFGPVSGPGSRTGGFINCRCSVYLGTVTNGGF